MRRQKRICPLSRAGALLPVGTNTEGNAAISARPVTNASNACHRPVHIRLLVASKPMRIVPQNNEVRLIVASIGINRLSNSKLTGGIREGREKVSSFRSIS